MAKNDSKGPLARRLWKGILAFFGVVFLLSMMIFVPWRLYLSFKVASELDRIREAGFPVTYEELNEWYKAVPDDKNAALLYLAAYDALEEEMNRFPEEKYDVLPLFSGLAESEVRIDDPDVALSTMQEFIEANGQALELLEKAGKLTESRYPIDFTFGGFGQMDHYSALRWVTRLLALEARTAAEVGDGNRATRALCDARAAARSLENEPQLIAQTTRSGLDSIAWGTLQRVLTRMQLTDVQLGRLTEAFEDKEHSKLLSRAVAAERAHALGYMNVSHLGILLDIDPDASDHEKREARREDAVRRLSHASGLTHIDMLYSLDTWDQMLAAAALPMPEFLAAIQAIETRLDNLPPFRARLTLLTVMPILWTPPIFAGHRADFLTVRTALAVERYRLDKGDLPEALSDLLPDYLDEIPVSPFDRQPLRYRQLEVGYVVSSRGTDPSDDAEEKPDSEVFSGDVGFRVHR